MRKLLRELRREFPHAKITITRRNHFRVALSNGRVVIVSGTPGDRNTLHIVRADMRRQSKEGVKP